MTPTLSLILAPPMMASAGRCGLSTKGASQCSSVSTSRPATAGIRCATPSVDAWALCRLPNASFT